jgi:AGCS family alanine or glycine:cation symporter
MTGTFIDTIVICAMTGLVIVISGAWDPSLKLEGVDITIEAFRRGLGFLGSNSVYASSFIIMVSLTFFAFTTILGWNYYSEKCLEYLIGTNKEKIVKIYRVVFVCMVFIGPYLTVSAVWGIADIINGLMALPNLIALVILSPVVAKTTCDFFKRADQK